jgi:hypothetical protein
VRLIYWAAAGSARMLEFICKGTSDGNSDAQESCEIPKPAIQLQYGRDSCVERPADLCTLKVADFTELKSCASIAT